MPIISLQLPDEISDPLADLACATDRNESYLVIAASSEYLTREVWLAEQIQQALNEADSEDFASSDEIRKIAEKWNANTPEQAPRLSIKPT
ncbi:CopG family ribbon-helix-helix protein [Pseudomonas protegens]